MAQEADGTVGGGVAASSVGREGHAAAGRQHGWWWRWWHGSLRGAIVLPLSRGACHDLESKRSNSSRKGVCKFYNGKSGSLAKLQDVVIPSLLKDLPKPETPSPRKRKGLLLFSFKWGKPQNKEV
ncbi:unnamed protein product [Miscanthus lutarioriparius]|uniref:Uncharacterized protein n=1 Tax=Miscanthus lutarioriparius TaxID=422564 RepID=A0A811NGV9_9POAL|nr:unnamed protein product [Miscanthus lutarioriparius]